MKTFLTAAALVVTLTAPVLAGMGMTAGSEAADEPFNSSFRQSAKEPGGWTPGHRAHARGYYVEKKKRSTVTPTGSASGR